ncbi:hypothetical protein ACTFIU_001623 [Dictyostelium citrinum]
MLKNNCYLFICIFLVTFFKFSSSAALELIVNSNNVNPSGNQCGDSLNNPCKSIPDAIAYYQIFITTPGNEGSSLVLKLVDGKYDGKANKFDFYGFDLTISPYTSGSQSVTVDGSSVTTSFISTLFDDNIGATILKVSNINFINFNANLLSTSPPKGFSTKFTFDSCKFSNGNQNFKFKLNADSKLDSNSIDFINSKFEGISVTNGLFSFINYKVQFVSSTFNTISMGDSFYPNLGTNSLTIDSSTFNQIQTNKPFISNNQGGSLYIKNSNFNNVNCPTFLEVYFNKDEVILTNNVFTNVDRLFAINDATVSFTKNTVNNNNNNIDSSIRIISIANSELSLDTNTINYPTVIKSPIYCESSVVEFKNNNGDSLIKTPSCISCNMIYNGNQICPSTTSVPTTSASTTSASTTSASTTSASTTSASTTSVSTATTTSTPTTSGEEHNNSSIDSKSASHLFFKLVCHIINYQSSPPLLISGQMINQVSGNSDIQHHFQTTNIKKDNNFTIKINKKGANEAFKRYLQQVYDWISIEDCGGIDCETSLRIVCLSNFGKIVLSCGSNWNYN